MKKKILVVGVALLAICGLEKEEEKNVPLMIGEEQVIQAGVIPPRLPPPPTRPNKLYEPQDEILYLSIIPPTRPPRKLTKSIQVEKEQEFIADIIPPRLPPRRITNSDQLA